MNLTRWPWISLLLAAAAILNPLGQDIIDAAFGAGEQLSRNIWQPIAYGAVLILISLVGLEWWIRRRRATRHTTSS